MQKNNTIKILQATTGEHLDHVRKLIRKFLEWHLERHEEDIQLINKYFDSKEFEEELKTLPGKYSMPGGRLLLAFYEKQPAGCVALRKIDEQICEMKRMFVYPGFHGKGIGFALAGAIIDEAKMIGYSIMRLDTSIRQTEAQKLYEALGFKKVEAYYELPQKLRDWLVFMELKL